MATWAIWKERAAAAGITHQPIFSWDNPRIHGTVGDNTWRALGITKDNHTLLPPYSPDMHFVIETSHAIICTALRKDINAARLPAKVRRSTRLARQARAAEDEASGGRGTAGAGRSTARAGAGPVAMGRGAAAGPCSASAGLGATTGAAGQAGPSTSAPHAPASTQPSGLSPDSFQYYTERLQMHFREKLTPKWAQGAVKHLYGTVLPAIIRGGGHYPSKKGR